MTVRQTPTIAAESGVHADLPEQAFALVRAAAVDEAGNPESVGELLTVSHDDEVVTTVTFAATLPGYGGWQWSVTAAHVGDDPWTISEVLLLPGATALVAPEWVPWDQRVQHGDLGAGDLLPVPEDDERLVPGYVHSDDPAVEALAVEIGLGRRRVLSMDGRADAAERWHDGAFGPYNEVAQQAPGRCGTCGFFTPLAGLLGGAFGACANHLSPGDGRVVAVEYGCGGHSEEAAAAMHHDTISDVVVDELQMDIHQRPEPSAMALPLALHAIGQLIPGFIHRPQLPAAPVWPALEVGTARAIALGPPPSVVAPIVLNLPVTIREEAGSSSAGDDGARDDGAGDDRA